MTFFPNLTISPGAEALIINALVKTAWKKEDIQKCVRWWRWPERCGLKERGYPKVCPLEGCGWSLLFPGNQEAWVDCQQFLSYMVVVNHHEESSILFVYIYLYMNEILLKLKSSLVKERPWIGGYIIQCNLGGTTSLPQVNRQTFSSTQIGVNRIRTADWKRETLWYETCPNHS
jgi:hypothetical protein